MEALSSRFGQTDGCTDLDNPTLATMAEHASCREYSSRPLDFGVVRTLCAVALSSPSKSDLQQRDIIVVEDPDQRARLHALFSADSWFVDAPVLLVFCANNRRQRLLAQWRQQEFANDHLDAFFNAGIDAAIALSALITAAESIGLGCCPISIIRNHAGEVSDILALPDYVYPVAGMGLGWPFEERAISMRLPLATTLHTDRFNDREVRSQVESYDAARQDAERDIKGERDGWSMQKARQYATPQRADFGAFIRGKKFNLD